MFVNLLDDDDSSADELLLDIFVRFEDDTLHGLDMIMAHDVTLF